MPGAKAVLFTSQTRTSGFGASNIDVASLQDGSRKTLVKGGTYPRYLQAPDGAGYLLYVTNNTLFAVGFDLILFGVAWVMWRRRWFVKA